MNDILRTDNYFATPIWSIQKPEWVEKINNACDKHINFAKKNLKKQIKENYFIKRKLEIMVSLIIQEKSMMTLI